LENRLSDADSLNIAVNSCCEKDEKSVETSTNVSYHLLQYYYYSLLYFKKIFMFVPHSSLSWFSFNINYVNERTKRQKFLLFLCFIFSDISFVCCLCEVYVSKAKKRLYATLSTTEKSFKNENESDKVFTHFISFSFFIIERK
jgi:hypothetical protein